MKRLLSLLVLLTTVSWCTWADETITVSANSEDISQALDLKAVAALFGTVKNVEEFETLLNNPDSAFTNLDLNGDGVVDYLRVVETSESNKHLVVIQAVLAKDVFQDVASIYVEKDQSTGQVTTQVIGDEYVYGENYIIEPVYIYRPYIYDWFWDPFWVCWTSPWYWGYYPHWWHSWYCCSWDHYWHHCYHWHHHHAYCSFRHASHPRPYYHDLRRTVSRREFANTHSDRSFRARHEGRASNARSIDAQRSTSMRGQRGGTFSRQGGGVASARIGQTAGGHRTAGRMDNTFGSRGVRRTSAGSTRQAAMNRGAGARTSQVATAVRPSSNSRTSASVHRGSAPTQRSSATTQRSTATTTRSSATTQRSSATTHRGSAPTRSSVTTSRSSAPTRSSSTSSSSRSSSRSSGSYSGSRSSGSSTRSSGSYGGGSRSGGGGFSGGSRSGGGGGGGRSGGGGPRR